MDIPARCRDEDGYLISQSLMTDIPYGCRTVAKQGCGFMAVQLRSMPPPCALSSRDSAG